MLRLTVKRLDKRVPGSKAQVKLARGNPLLVNPLLVNKAPDRVARLIIRVGRRGIRIIKMVSKADC